jgi:hypothetical protein
MAAHLIAGIEGKAPFQLPPSSGMLPPRRQTVPSTFVSPITEINQESCMNRKNLALACLLGAVTALSACGKSEPKTEALPAAAPASAATPSSSPAAGATEMGLAIYPGADTMMSGHKLAGDNSATMYDSAFKSADKPEKVAAFYRDELAKLAGDKSQVSEPPMGEGFVHLIGGKDESKYYDVMIRPEDAGTVFSIKTIVKAN